MVGRVVWVLGDNVVQNWVPGMLEGSLFHC